MNNLNVILISGDFRLEIGKYALPIDLNNR
jgi:hypothetical protein